MTKLEEIALIKEQMRNLVSTAKEEKRSLTEGEQEKFNDLLSRKNQLTIDEALRNLEREKQLASRKIKEPCLRKRFMMFVITDLCRIMGNLPMRKVSPSQHAPKVLRSLPIPLLPPL